MYLNSLHFQNYGPLESCKIEFVFDKNGNPLPMILVGANGSGKTVCLSVALDAFISMRAEVSQDSPEILKGKLFKPLKQANRYLGRSGLTFCKCVMRVDNAEIIFSEYMTTDKIDGKFSLPDGDIKPQNFDEQRFEEMGMSKSLSVNDPKIINSAVANEIFSYYPTGRAERPGWLSDSSPIKFGISPRYQDVTGYNCWRTDLIDGLSGWLLDVVLDSELYDITPTVCDYQGYPTTGFVKTTGRNRKLLNHVNHILTEIIRTGKPEYESARIAISERNNGSRSISVYAKRIDSDQEDVIASSLKDLSTGELAILCIFADLIRVAEIQGWNRNDLAEIKGIALVDEADLHLHVRLQKDVLPKLVTLMPKVQFVLTTHSPLLALGAADYGATIINIPTGRISDPTEFSEFDEAYQIFVDKNEQFKRDLSSVKEQMAKTTRPLVITEGKTDKKHLELAMRQLLQNGLIPEMDLDFHDVGNDMGSSELQKIYEVSTKMMPDRPIICIFDRDETRIVTKYGSGDGFISNGNVVGLCLAVPEHRDETPEICIEHLYFDDILKTCIAGSEKRLRFENEIGLLLDRKTAFIKPTPERETLKIYDQDVGQLGLEDGSRKGEFAVSKNTFFEEIVAPQPAGIVDFVGFIKTFELIDRALRSIAT